MPLLKTNDAEPKSIRLIPDVSVCDERPPQYVRCSCAAAVQRCGRHFAGKTRGDTHSGLRGIGLCLGESARIRMKINGEDREERRHHLHSDAVEFRSFEVVTADGRARSWSGRTGANVSTHHRRSI